MNVIEAIAQRRSIKKFQDRPLTREELEPLLDAAVLAPNHHLTQPWRFYVLGPESRRRYGLALGDRKARKLPDPDARAAVGVRDGERIVVMLSVGVPAEVPPPKPRQGAAAVTVWVD